MILPRLMSDTRACVTPSTFAAADCVPAVFEPIFEAAQQFGAHVEFHAASRLEECRIEENAALGDVSDSGFFGFDFAHGLPREGLINLRFGAPRVDAVAHSRR